MALVNAPFARAGPVAAPRAMADVYRAVADEASRSRLGAEPWLAISAAATFTLNSPDALAVLFDVATSDGNRRLAGDRRRQREPGPEQARPQERARSRERKQAHHQAQGQLPTAELMREVGLKCISFNGIPRTINCLNAFHAHLPTDVAAQLGTRPSRQPTEENLDAVAARGRHLWDSIYAPFQDKLLAKLALAHPDLPVHILHSHYGPLLSDPPASDGASSSHLGRVLTSIVAIACLRAQTGVGPQVLSHLFGLRKAWEDGTWKDGPALDEEAVRWLAGDKGNEWILRSVDRIVDALAGGNSAASPKL
ncbi:hypothetical protein RJ55_04570 [Drechmeria coniospora]|nr:hypothetical protein RJ55_04570 [Drechmeria coniospora]